MKILLVTLVTALALAASGCSTQEVTDSAITTKVKSKLVADTRTSAIKIEVDTVNGVVILTGAVPTAAEKAAAGEIAKATEDVKSVTNNLTVQPAVSNTGNAAASVGAATGDALILSKIKAKYVAEGIIGTNVDVTNGVVMLKGEVENAQERTKAGELARTTEDVKSVTNQLTIKKR